MQVTGSRSRSHSGQHLKVLDKRNMRRKMWTPLTVLIKAYIQGLSLQTHIQTRQDKQVERSKTMCTVPNHSIQVGHKTAAGYCQIVMWNCHSTMSEPDFWHHEPPYGHDLMTKLWPSCSCVMLFTVRVNIKDIYCISEWSGTDLYVNKLYWWMVDRDTIGESMGWRRREKKRLT